MTNLPYITSPGNIDKALTGIKAASLPERVSQDFVKTILHIPGGSGDQMTSFLKKLGLANPDGTPTELYRKFRNPSSSAYAIATAVREAYSPLYLRNEYMHELSDNDLLGLVVEETGQAHDSNPVKLIVSSIKHLKKHADFSNDIPNHQNNQESSTHEEPIQKAIASTNQIPSPHAGHSSIGLNLGYTINLNLPASSDPAVFEAIFTSLKLHLLSNDDA